MPKRNNRGRTASKPTSVITGGAGFLGSHLTDLLLSRGHRVIGIDNFVTGSVDNIAHLAGNPDYKFIQQDVTEYLFLEGPVDYVWHFASPASPIDYLELPIQTLKVGSLGTHKALGLAKEKGLELLMFNERHFRLRFKTNCWEIYPGKLRIQRLSESTPFIFGLPHDWTLIDVVNHAANTVKAWSDAREQAARK